MNSIHPQSTISEIRQSLISGQLRIDNIGEIYYNQIEKYDQHINAYISIIDFTAEDFFPERPLSGIYIALKDLIETRGIKTTCGAGFLCENIPLEDAIVVRKLRNAGASIIGKTNMHEIALGVTNINDHYGNCRNPWDVNRISGGSSGGSAAAVAVGMCTAALGTDTGGSIRIPSSLCGVVGLKPTFGRVSLNGVFPLSWNLDHVGPITRSVLDAAIILQIIAGYDDADPVCVDKSEEDYISHIGDEIQNLRIALATGDYLEAAEPEIVAAVQSASSVMKSKGAIISEVDINWLKNAALANGIITTADAAAVYQDRIETDPDDFGDDVLYRLLIGSSYSSSEYSRARRVQVEMKRKFQRFFRDYDLLMLPTTPVAAPLIEGADAIEQARRLTRFTAPFNLSGLPAISIPCGFTSNGLPIGLQLVSNLWDEKVLLNVANVYECSTGWMESRSIPIME